MIVHHFVLALLFAWPAMAWAGLGGAAIAVAAAYFYRRRSRVVLVPAIDDWLRVGRPVDAKSVSTLLRSLLSMLAQLTLVALIAWALADALLAKPEARKVAIVIDAGATMHAKDAGRSRFDAALDAARAKLEQLPEGCDVYLIVAAHRPIVAQSSATDRHRAMKDLDAVETMDVESDLGAAVRAAAAFVGKDPEAEVVVISDFSAEPPSAVRTVWTHPAKVTLAPVGADAPDAAVTNVWCDRSANGCTIGATVTSRGMTGRSAPVRIESGGATIWSGSIDLGDVPATFGADVKLPPVTAFQVIVDAQDALAVDDVAFGVTPPPRRSVCLVTRGNAPLERAIRADPSARLRVLSPEQYSAGSVAADEILVADNVDLPALPDHTPCLLIAARDPRGRVEVSEPAEVGPITHWIDHPALADVEPDLIRVKRAMRVQPGSRGAITSLVSATETPLIVSVTEPRGENASPPPPILLWLFRIEDTDIASRPSFPVLVWDAIDFLAGEERGAATRMMRTGRPMQIGAAPGIAVTDPTGKPIDLRPVGEQLAARDVVRQGVYQVTRPTGTEPLAVNLLSDRGTRSLEREGADAEPVRREPSNVLPWWRKLPRWELIAAGALLLAGAEWALFHRGVLRIA